MQEDSSRSTCARMEKVLSWQRRSQSLNVQGWGAAKSSLCYFTLYHFFLGKRSINRGLIQGYPSMSWMSPQWAQRILRLYRCWNSCWGLRVRWVTRNTTSVTLHLADKWVPPASSGPEREDIFVSAPVL